MSGVTVPTTRILVPVDEETAAGVTDHGLLTGLADNDHPQYAVVNNAFPTRLWITADATNPAGSVDGDYRIRPA